MAKDSLFSKLLGLLNNITQEPAAETPPSETPPAAAPALKLVVFIVDWSKGEIISDVLLEEKVRFHFMTKGTGTSSNEILDLFGIGKGDKAVVFCLEQAVLIPVLMKEARKKLGFYTPGQGIVFTVSLSAINDPVLLIFKQSVMKNEKIATETGKESLEPELSQPQAQDNVHDNAYDLIISIVNEGYSDDVMNTARAAGASSGTVLNARGQFHEGVVRFFGISVQHEKKMILILTKREKKEAIIKAIFEAHGFDSKAHGIVFSLPVDNVMGLSSEQL